MSARPRGFIEQWRPRAETPALLDIILHVLAEYAAHLPLTIRQIFYRLVGRHNHAKTERAYKKLVELLNKARRAGGVEMDAIRDDGFVEVGGGYRHADHVYNSIVEDIERTARYFRLDRQKGQARRLALSCEASGMVPQLRRITDPFGIGVFSSGGFDSLGDKHRIERRWTKDGAVMVLHVDDHDPSGVHVCKALGDDVGAFARHYGGDIEFTRLAVTLEQARQYRLPSALPKASDRRSFDGDETYQAEALGPRDLADIVRNAIEVRLDRAVYEAVVIEEREARQDVLSRLGLDRGANRP